MTWDVTVPAGTDNIREGDDAIRTFKTDIQTALQAKGNFPVSTSSPVYQYVGDKGDTASRPTNSEGGLYFDTDTDEILRDNDSSWDVVGINFASGTDMLFYQAAAPTGWTKSTANNDKFLRVVSGSGGSAAGAWTSHTHTGPSHTHVFMYTEDQGDSGASSGVLSGQRSASGANQTCYQYRTTADNENLELTTSTGALTQTVRTISTQASGTAATGSDTHAAADHEYIDVIVCSKD